MAGEKLPPLFLFNDEPVRSYEDDHLSLKPFSSMIAAAALSNRGPFNIGVFSGWGQGKTSVLRQAQSLIERENKPNVITAWVNAWQYEHEDHPIVPLLAIIINEITKALDSKKSADTKADETIVKTFGNLKRALRAIAYGFSAKANAKIPGFANLEIGFVAKDMIDRDEKLSSDRDPLLDQSLYYHAYERLESFRSELELAGPGDQPKIIIFIDDLDRCLPAKALHLLESLKLALAQQGFIFVLGVDRHVIDSFLTKRYHEDFGIETDMGHGRQYMDKLIQLPLDLPHHQNRFEKYIENLIHGNQSLPSEFRSIFSNEEAGPAFISALAAGCDRTPRTLIRTLNYLLTDLFLRENQISNQSDDIFSSSAEFLQLAAISRITRLTLGSSNEKLYRKLTGEDWFCRQLAAYLRGEENIWHASLNDPEWGYNSGPEGAKRYQKDIDKIEPYRIAIFAFDSLHELFRTDFGHDWLTNPVKRKAVEGFLAARAEPTQQPDESSQQIIMSAIRLELRLQDDQGIGDDERRKVLRLDLSDTQVSDLTQIKSLPFLQSLSLESTRVSDLTPLRSLEALQSLDLRNTKTSDVSALANLTKLQDLDLSFTNVTEIAPLKNLINMKSLNLIGTQVSDITILSKLLNLSYLYLNHTKVSNIAALQGITTLSALSLSETQVRDITPLASLTRLGDLSLGSTLVSDVTALYELKNCLRRLWLEDTPAGQDQSAMAKLRDALPNTTISP